jgi:hypothetical protein
MDNALPSPPGLPLWWRHGSSYPYWLKGEIIEKFKADRFALLIFLAEDRTRMPQQLLDYIEAAYAREPGYKTLDVYRARDER